MTMSEQESQEWREYQEFKKYKAMMQAAKNSSPDTSVTHSGNDEIASFLAFVKLGESSIPASSPDSTLASPTPLFKASISNGRGTDSVPSQEASLPSNATTSAQKGDHEGWGSPTSAPVSLSTPAPALVPQVQPNVVPKDAECSSGQNGAGGWGAAEPDTQLASNGDDGWGEPTPAAVDQDVKNQDTGHRAGNGSVGGWGTAESDTRPANNEGGWGEPTPAVVSKLQVTPPPESQPEIPVAKKSSYVKWENTGVVYSQASVEPVKELEELYGTLATRGATKSARRRKAKLKNRQTSDERDPESFAETSLSPAVDLNAWDSSKPVKSGSTGGWADPGAPGSQREKDAAGWGEPEPATDIHGGWGEPAPVSAPQRHTKSAYNGSGEQTPANVHSQAAPPSNFGSDIAAAPKIHPDRLRMLGGVPAAGPSTSFARTAPPAPLSSKKTESKPSSGDNDHWGSQRSPATSTSITPTTNGSAYSQPGQPALPAAPVSESGSLSARSVTPAIHPDRLRMLGSQPRSSAGGFERHTPPRMQTAGAGTSNLGPPVDGGWGKRSGKGSVSKPAAEDGNSVGGNSWGGNGGGESLW